MLQGASMNERNPVRTEVSAEVQAARRIRMTQAAAKMRTKAAETWEAHGVATALASATPGAPLDSEAFAKALDDGAA
jgi:hypothetical protein